MNVTAFVLWDRVQTASVYGGRFKTEGSYGGRFQSRRLGGPFSVQGSISLLISALRAEVRHTQSVTILIVTLCVLCICR